MKSFYSFLILLICNLSINNEAIAQMVGDNIFLPGQFLEVGIAPNGSLGSTRQPPSGYYARAPTFNLYDPAIASSATVSNALSMVYDQGHDGWTTGSPAYFGDYTLPGTPYEGWGIEIAGTHSEAQFEYYDAGTTTGFSGGTLTGTNSAYSNSGGKLIGLWKGSAASGQLQITQTTEVDTAASWVLFNITLVNTGTSTLSNVYYLRACDPDNDSYTGGSAYTNNSINYQDDYANRVEVTAAGTYYTAQTLSLLTKDCRAKCFIEPSWPISSGASLASVYSGTSGYTYTGTNNGDYAIGIVWNLGNIGAGDTTKIFYAYAYNGLYGVDSAISNPELVTLGVAHDTTDTVTSCSFSGDTLYATISNGNTGNWAGSTWTWAPSTALTATTGLASDVIMTSVSSAITYTITGTGSSAFGSCATKTFLLTVLPRGATPPPTVHDTSFCLGTAGGSLVAYGTGTIYWYTTATGGTGSTTAPIPSTSTLGTTTYWVSQTVAGCASARVAVNVTIVALPASISGASSVCIGYTTSLTDASTGGHWTSSATAIGTIGSSTGVVGGIATGTTTISYTVSSGCSNTKIVTVNPNPSAIGGTFALCQGATASVADGGGGTWSSSASGIAGINSTTGVVTGVSAGTATITYTLPTGCYITATETINAAPANITGVLHTCPGLTTTLGDITTGGTWSSTSPGVGTISTTGVFTGISSGVTTISYTAAVGGCASTAVVTVNPLPSGIAGVPSVCLHATDGLFDLTTGGTWSSSNSGVVSVGSLTGVAIGVSVSSATITYTLATGCYSTFMVSVTPLPAPITGGDSLCLGSTLVLSDASAGDTWSSSDFSIAYIDATGTVTGEGLGIATISYTDPVTNCSATLPVSVDPLPTAIFGSSHVCLGSTTVLTDGTGGGTWTSSNPAIGSIGSSTGIVTGVALGSVTITYTMPSGCFVTASMVVSPLPGPISGTTTLCVGASTTLTDLTTGGTWTSSTPTIGSILPTTGVLTGVSSGTATISYTISSTGCRSTTLVTINSAPSPITGTMNVCVGGSITLSDATSGGLWSDSPLGIGTMSSTTGTFTGVAAGVAVVTYSVGVGCAAYAAVTVNPLPSTIGGVTHVCQGSTITLTDGGGGTWSSSLTAIGTVGASSGIVFGVSPGTTVITYTLGTGCSRSTNVTVNGLPASFSVTGGGSFCVGGTGVDIGLSGSVPGVTYQLYLGTTATGAPMAGTGSSLDFGLHTATGTYTVIATISATGCSSTMSGSAVISTNPLPLAYTVTGGGGRYCSGGTGVTVCLAGSSLGVSYQAQIGTTAYGPVVAGTGGAICLGPLTTAGAYTILATNITTGCSRTMTGTYTVTVDPTPVITGPTAVCVGSTITENSSVASGTWNSSVPSVASVATASPTTASVIGHTSGSTTVITYTAPASSGSCSANITVTVSPSPSGIVGLTTVCEGLTDTLSDIVVGGGWTSTPATLGSIDPASGVFYASSSATGRDSITYSLGTGCTVGINITINPAPAGISGTSVLCAGSTGSETDASGGGTWTSSNTALVTIGSSSGSITASAFSSGVDTITYTRGCPVTKTVTVNAIPASISGTNNVCRGSSITLSSSTPGGTWSVSGSATISGTSGTATLTGGTVTAATAITVTYAVGGCSTALIVTVNPLPSTIVNPGHVCTGSTITLSDVSTGGTWSSSVPTIGSINTTGVFSGLTSGTTIVTYTLTTGCATNTSVTVNQSPGPISGPSGVCVSLNITLADGTPGGTWSSSDPTKATIVAGTGYVSGVAHGAVTMSYSIGGCAASYPFSVISSPGPITGSGNVCAGQTTTLSDTSTGGSWSSGSPAIATITSGGVVLGVSTGTAIITYGVSGGCYVVRPIVVDPITPIFGTPFVCVGQTTMLFDSTSGAGTWSSSSDSATVDAHGVVAGINPGVFTISYELTTGCITTTPVTVNPIPAPISGPGNVCVGATIALTDVTISGTWSSSNPSVGSVDAAGNLTGVSATTPTGVTVTYAMPVTGCPVTKVIIVNPLPLPISGISNVCLGGTTTLSETTSGSWVSLAPGIASVSPSTGTSTVVTGVTLGTTTISYTTAATGCATSTTVNVASPPPPINHPLSLCQDGSLTLTDPAGTGSWYSGNPTVATVDVATGVVTPGSYGTSLITYVAPAGCSITAILTVNPTPIVPSEPTTLCPGQMVTYTTTSGGIWSSSDPTVATIGSTSGTTTAIMPVTTTITYTLPTGCAMSFPVFVNTPPDPITGNPAICITNTTTLSDGTPGGTWSSDHIGIASVDAFGTVTGNALGTAIISYMVSGTVCPSTLEVTVNPQPTAITGRMAICQGDNTMLSDGIAGGTWATSDATIATVNSAGTVTGVISGYITPMTADITYSLGSGCTKTVTVTVNPIPQPVSGPNTLCANSVVSLYDPTIGGTWSSASTSVATIDASGNLTGINPGGVSIVSYTQNGCAATYPVTVNTQPTAITGNTNVCLDGTSMLHETYGPGTWMSTGTGIATINSTTGLVTGISTGATTIVYTMTTGSCIASVVVNVKPLPTVFNITGGGNYCAGGSGVPIGLDGSNTGTTYLLYHGSTAAGTYTGTGSALDFGSQTVAGNYVAVATTSSTGCSKTMAGIANIVINPTVTPAVVISTPSDSVCAGTSATFTPAPTNGGLLPSYIWSVNGVGVGPGNTYTFVPANGDVVSAVMYSSANCPAPATANSNNVTMVVMPYENARVSISSVPSDTVCKGTEVTLNAVTTAGGNQPVYLWRLNGMLLIGSSNGSYTYVPDNGDQLFVHLTGNYKCALGTDDSSTLRMQVDTAAMPIVTINANPGTVLGLGQTGTFTASVTNAVNPTYQWIKNGYPIIGATNASYSAHDFSYPREDSLTCMVTSNGICKITSFQWVYVQVSTEGVQQISSSASDFTVVPNPNKGEFTIKGSMSTTADENVTMELTDVLGQVVYHNDVLAKGGKISEHVQVGNTLANGMYILNLRSDSDNKVFHIVIEQ